MPVYLDDLDPQCIAVQLFANGDANQAPEVHTMTRGDPLAGAINSYSYFCELPVHRSADQYTPRIVPHREHCLVPMEASQILWYR